MCAVGYCIQRSKTGTQLTSLFDEVDQDQSIQDFCSPDIMYYGVKTLQTMILQYKVTFESAGVGKDLSHGGLKKAVSKHRRRRSDCHSFV